LISFDEEDVDTFETHIEEPEEDDSEDLKM